MKNVVLTRVDDRLLHGQVVVSWIPYLKANEVIVVDDELAQDEFMSLLIKNAEPENVNVCIFTVEEAAEYLKGEDTGSRILILVKNIGYIKRLLELNTELNKINVGNLGSNEKRKKFHNSVYLSDEEYNVLSSISEKTEVEIRMLPRDKEIKFDKVDR
ncbi:PTS sugar transporter subunit IIB [Sedimentibacter sp.]|uniref:PTS system mannose/fructose/N-acetylgalactosamine-transporter subunit IIB n=1 Tax=Sedimentibacter sp. TaxID=1960295 RepID=UPI00289A39B3|nr:PTS sugar transporter subunit IIB [Sedimentibacter sp.]